MLYTVTITRWTTGYRETIECDSFRIHTRHDGYRFLVVEESNKPELFIPFENIAGFYVKVN